MRDKLNNLIITYYVVNINGKLVGYTSDLFILNELRRYKKSLMCDNIFIQTYNCSPNRLVDILTEDYFAEDIYGLDLLDSTRLRLYTSSSGKNVITSYSFIYETIESTDCVAMVSHNIVKALTTLIKYARYIKDPLVSDILSYITLTYTKRLIRDESISGNITELLDDDDLCIDIIDILIILGYLSPI